MNLFMTSQGWPTTSDSHFVVAISHAIILSYAPIVH